MCPKTVAINSISHFFRINRHIVAMLHYHLREPESVDGSIGGEWWHVPEENRRISPCRRDICNNLSLFNKNSYCNVWKVDKSISGWGCHFNRIHIPIIDMLIYWIGLDGWRKSNPKVPFPLLHFPRIFNENTFPIPLSSHIQSCYWSCWCWLVLLIFNGIPLQKPSHASFLTWHTIVNMSM